MIKLTSLLKDSELYEGLIYSVSNDALKSHIEKWTISKHKIKVKIINEGTIHLSIFESLNEKDMKNLLTWINNLGWTISSFIDFKKYSETNVGWGKFDEKQFLRIYSNENKGVVFELKPKFNVERPHEDFSKKYYHVSPSKYETKILKVGLVPKSKEKISAHGDRIYVTVRLEDAIALAESFSVIEKETQFTIFEVNMESAKKANNGIRLFIDPDLYSGSYTLSNIPPQFLKVVKRISV